MSEARRLRDRLGPALLVALCALVVFLQLVPLGSAPGNWPGPDLMLCLVLAWAIRRPEDLPVLLVAALFLAADLLLMRPPGLWAALVVVAVEALRRRQGRVRGTAFAAEWALVAALVAALSLAYWAVLTVTLVGQPSLSARLAQAVSTLLAYPLVAAGLHFVLDVRKRPAPEGFGRRARG